MSLDVTLTMKKYTVVPVEHIYVREDGATKEITRDEWDERFPNREPVTVTKDTQEVYWKNITHNLNQMAREAGIYEAMWRPDENNITTATQLIAPLTNGLALLKSDPERFKKFNPENRWGNYENLVGFVESYLNACKEYPEAEVSVSR